MERKIQSMPDTSHAANKAATLEMRTQHYDKIVKALQVLKMANYEKIAEVAGFHDRNQVSRRLKEMVGLGMIYKTDLKSATTSGRMGYNYSLITQPEMTVSEQVDQMIFNATKPEMKQIDLFP